MANICSIGLHLHFGSIAKAKAFVKDFTQKIKEADAKHEGVRIAKNKWLFDSDVMEHGLKSKDISIHGSVRWALDQDDMAEWHQYLKEMQVKYYEELGCMVFGKYEYDGEVVTDTYIPIDSPIWNNDYWDDDNYFEKLEEELEDNGTVEALF
jgi:hypothetical protein